MAAWFKFSFSFVWWKIWLFACEGPAGWLLSCSRFNGHVTLNIIFIFWFLDKIEQDFLVFRFLVTNFLIQLQDRFWLVHWSSVAISPQRLSCAEHLTILSKLLTFLIFSADNVRLQIWPGKHRKESPLKKEAWKSKTKCVLGSWQNSCLQIINLLRILRSSRHYWFCLVFLFNLGNWCFLFHHSRIFGRSIYAKVERDSHTKKNTKDLLTDLHLTNIKFIVSGFTWARVPHLSW